MINQIGSLTALREAVEAGDLWRDDWPVMAGISKHGISLGRAVRDKSTDAALQWLAAVLPGCRWVMSSDACYCNSYLGKADNPATALILAGLNALIAQKEQDDD